MDCIKAVVGQDLSKEIKQILLESVWNVWSDEDDLSLVIQSLSVSDAGIVTIKWLDETEDSTELERYTPRRKIKECNTTMMTKEEKIAMLRQQGIPFSKIAIQLDMKRDTVKSYCRRNNIGVKKENDDPNTPRCKNCGAILVQTPKRKKKVFCCNKCRNEWWAAHPDKINKKAIYTHTCLHCKKEFTAYGNNERNTVLESALQRRGLAANRI